MIEIFDSWLWFVTTNPGVWLLPLLAAVWFYRRLHVRTIPQNLSIDHYFQHLNAPAWFADKHFQLRQQNPAMSQFQWPTGLRPQLFSSRKCLHSAWPDIQAELDHNHHWQGIVWQPTVTSPRALQLTITPLTRHQPIYYLVVQQDISQQQQQQAELEQLITHDALTGVSNRTLWIAQLEPVLKQCQDARQHCAILLIELSERDKIQQQFGFNQAQQFEQWTAQQLQRHLPAGAILGQFSDRLFAVILTSQHCQAEPEQASLQIAQQLKLAVHGPCLLGDFDFIGKCAIGIALFPQGGEDVETLLQHANWALQQSLVQHEVICVWQRSGQAAIADADVAEALQHGLKQYEFELYFQGCYQLQDKKLLALDVQLAWHSPSRGLLWLPQFRAAAEQSHLLLALERWRFSQLCQQIWQWRQQGYQLPKFRVELSTLQLQQPDLLPYLLHQLQEWQLQPELLQLGINEQYWLQQPGRAMTQLLALKQAGFYLIWQDFGAGHTALALLAEGFWSEVMLAASLIDDLEYQDNQRNICASLIRLAGYHQLTCSAQSVNNEMQGYLLHVMGCETGQGQLFDQPHTAEQISTYFIQQPIDISRAG